MKAAEILEQYIGRQYRSREGYFRANKRILLKYSEHLIKAQFDEAGNCIICREAGECPGWHLPEERQPVLKSVCAWCHPNYPEEHPDEVVTSGMCSKHLEEMMDTLNVMEER